MAIWLSSTIILANKFWMTFYAPIILIDGTCLDVFACKFCFWYPIVSDEVFYVHMDVLITYY